MVAKEERDKLGELYGELFTDIVLQLGRVYILSLLSTSKNLSILNLLGFTICAHEVNCRNNQCGIWYSGTTRTTITFLVVFWEICVVIVVLGLVVLGRPIGRPIFF